MLRGDICLYVSPANRSRLDSIGKDGNGSSRAVPRAEVALTTGDEFSTNAVMKRTGKSQRGRGHRIRTEPATVVDDALVIGSGPAGVAATAALLAAQRTVKMLDIGARLEGDRTESMRELSRRGKARADDPEWSFARAGLATRNKIPLKT